MNEMDIMFKSITLLYRESYLINKNNKSNNLIRTIMQSFKTSSKYTMLGANNEINNNLKKFILDMCNQEESEIDKEMLLQSISLIVGKDNNVIDILKKTIEVDLVEDKLVRAVLTLRKYLNNYNKELEINELLSNAHFRFKNHRSGIKSTSDFVNNLVNSLEGLDLNGGGRDSAIVSEVDIDNPDSIKDVLDTVKEESVDAGRLKTGWYGMNKMTNGGFRRGESVCLASLQHKYKSGTTNTMFMQIAMNNEPKMIDPDKKPLLLLISMEDDMPITIDFMYRYLYFDEFNKLPNLNEITTVEATEYVVKKLSVKGYNAKMLRVDPTSWSVQGLFNLLDGFESKGYEIHGLFLDYLSMIPTTGCNVTGPMGTDIRDLIRRVRNFTSCRGITLFSPHQLSVDAKMLIRNGVPESTFVKELVGKGFFSGTKQLDQEFDLIMYQHIAKINNKASLVFARDKHRTPIILEDKYKYWYMPFPDKAPIPSDITRDKTLAIFPDAGGVENEFDF